MIATLEHGVLDRFGVRGLFRPGKVAAPQPIGLSLGERRAEAVQRNSRGTGSIHGYFESLLPGSFHGEGQEQGSRESDGKGADTRILVAAQDLGQLCRFRIV